ncbi:programmed cell death 1 ligand 1 [Carettochelys insculpta]|uniref:programmed cell death 1 ligand 1 n=1 Tax=Carettochelys insculpta TaxID=44489 RepID=UPI003EBED623
MEKTLLLSIFVFHWHFINALFTVDVPHPQYTVDYGSNVTMECRFQVNGQLKLQDLSVIWEKKEEEAKEIYKLHKGKENFTTQHSDFRERVQLLKEKLQLGQSMLQITSIKLTDAGTYRCLIGYEGADYKTITLQVRAPYRNITKRIVTAEHNKWELMCQSEGYPKAEVIWQNVEHQDLSDKANTISETGTDQLYSVTSTLKINTSINATFQCIFWNKELKENTSAILIIPDYTVDSQRTNSRRYIGTALGVFAVFGSLLLCVLWIKKARKDEESETWTNNATMKVSCGKLSTDEEEGNCRETLLENEKLKNVRIVET